MFTLQKAWYNALVYLVNTLKFLNSENKGNKMSNSTITKKQAIAQIIESLLEAGDLEELLHDSHIMVELLNECFAAATQENKQDIANFIAERLTATNKFIWMLSSFLREARA